MLTITPRVAPSYRPCLRNNDDNIDDDNDRIERRKSRFLNNLLTAPRTVSNTRSSVQGAIVCNSRATHWALRIFNSNVKSVLLYGCETWRTTQTTQRKIQTFFNTCLRRIYKIQWKEKILNEDLWERAGQEPVAKQILRRKWGWIGHTLRKPASSTTRQALTWDTH